MNYKTIGRVISQILYIEAALMLPAVFIGLYDKTHKANNAFIATILITVLAASVLYAMCRKASSNFRVKEGLFCVGIAWIVMSIFGCLPFYLSGEINGFVNSFFEIVSGFTTTGASVVPDVEKLTRSMLYWRSFSHWIGGMGVLVFLMAIVPSAKKDGGHTLFLLRAESPGPEVDKIVPHMKQTAKILYLIYIALTILDFGFLLAGGMSVFDAFCTAVGTAGTGGFGIKADSLASYSPYIQNVCTVFMFLFGINFNCFYLLLLRRFKSVFKNEELRLYVLLALCSTLVISFNIKDMFTSFGEALRHSAFQVASVMTTTGFSSCDFNLWPIFPQTILLCLMFVGACAGSTGGGMKCSRVLLMFKSLRRNIRCSLYPRKVEAVLTEGRPVNESVLKGIYMYLVAYVGILILSFIIISADGFSITTNISSVISCFNNIGPGLDATGPMANYSIYSPLSKIVLIFDMLAGRLEIFPIIALFSRHTWK